MSPREQQDLRSSTTDAVAAQNKLRIAVSGASSLIGSHLVPSLAESGHEVIPMVNSRQERDDHEQAIYWNYQERIVETDKLKGVDAVIHLAGERTAAFRWNERTKMQVYTSRVRGTQLISEAIADMEDPPAIFLSASDVGIYGNRGDEVLTEESPVGQDGFLTAVCRDWELATHPAKQAGIRTVLMRLGILLTPKGGLLEHVAPHFKLGLGGRIGDPNQYVPWIAMEDVVHSTRHLLETKELEGPVNIAAPEPVTTSEFARILARVLGRPAFLNIPSSVVKLLLGNAAEEFVLKSTRVRPKRLEETGYQFLYPTLEKALRHQLGKEHAS